MHIPGQMLPSFSPPDFRTFVFPETEEHSPVSELHALVQSMICKTRYGTYTARRMARKRNRTSEKRIFPSAPLRVHVPLFRLMRSMPSFQYPSRELTEALAAHPLLEVAAGSGLMSFLTAAAGGDVIATDIHPWNIGESYFDILRENDNFEQRQRACRVSGRDFYSLRKKFIRLPESNSSPISRTNSGPCYMYFQKLKRPPLRRKNAEPFYPVLRLSASEALKRFPDRNILLLSPDPVDDEWVHLFMEELPEGKKIFFLDDYGDHRKCPAGFSIVRTFPAYRSDGDPENVHLLVKLPGHNR